MENEITLNWWALLLRGIASIIFGILAFIWPGVALLSLVFVFGAYAIIDGILSIIAGARSPKGGMWWMLILVGILGLAAGVVAFVLPGVTAFALVMLIAAWAFITGILEIAAAIQLRRQITGEWLMILGGAASVVFGVLLAINPGAGAMALVWIIGFYAILYGILLTVLGWRLHGMAHPHHPAPHPV
jgi:uncharacterized membrane protein HdeD (DUF308 family)